GGGAIDARQTRRGEPGGQQAVAAGRPEPGVADERSGKRALERRGEGQPGSRIDSGGSLLDVQPQQSSARRRGTGSTGMSVRVDARSQPGGPAEPGGDLMPGEEGSQHGRTAGR